MTIQPQPRLDDSALNSDTVHWVISRYFETLNDSAFAETIELFAPTGVLYPPFEDAIIGREAILSYLEAEAKGLQLFPEQRAIEHVDAEVQVRVGGKVQTPFFKVNVAWIFITSTTGEILSVRVKLLAALEELLQFKQ